MWLDYSESNDYSENIESIRYVDLCPISMIMYVSMAGNQVNRSLNDSQIDNHLCLGYCLDSDSSSSGCAQTVLRLCSLPWFGQHSFLKQSCMSCLSIRFHMFRPIFTYSPISQLIHNDWWLQSEMRNKWSDVIGKEMHWLLKVISSLSILTIIVNVNLQ